MAAEPGWYADPQGPGTRWWDGDVWTEHTDDAVAGQALAPLVAQTAPGYGPVAPPVGVWRGPIDDRPYVGGLADAVRVVLGKYAQFDGRAGLAEFWWWTLAVTIAYLGAVAMMLIPFVGFLVALLLLVAALGIVVPNYAVTVRRLRDAGFHWAWIFLVFAPFGGIALIVMCAQPSKFP